MSHSGVNVSFILITAFVLLSAAGAAFARNIVQAAYSLFFTLFGMAGYYVLLGSGFLAITQVVIYVGGILVLLMFGILLTERPFVPIETLGEWRFARFALGACAVAILLFVLFGVFDTTQWQGSPPAAEPVESIREVGSALLERYLLTLEVAGITLLLCLLGAAYLVRREE
jgi:NADH:ubiquinone oxidoreductase subunit 6 (subunit J)